VEKDVEPKEEGVKNDTLIKRREVNQDVYERHAFKE